MAKYQFKTQPYEHQKEALRRGWDKEYFAYFMEMGTGKTKVLLDNTCILYERGKIDAMVVLAPKGVYLNWGFEIDIHVPDIYRKQMTIAFWRAGLPKYIQRNIVRASECKGLAVLLMNIESMNSHKGARVLEAFMHQRKCMLIVDESTKIKNINSNMTKKLVDIADLATYRRIATGWPVPNTAMDLFGQSQFLQKGLLAKSEAGFRTMFCQTHRLNVQYMRGGKQRTHIVHRITGSKNVDVLHEKMDQWSYRVQKVNCLDLPAKVYQQIIVEMTPEQKKIYNEFKAVAYYEFKDKQEISASVVLTQLLRLHQIVCGSVKTDEGNIISIKNNRLPALMDVLEGVSGKVIIWANYVHDIQAIVTAVQKEYGVGSCVEYYGSTSVTQRENAIQELQNGAARFFISNTQTGGFGITLTAANTHIYYSNNYSLENRMQSEDRSHRIGQHYPVTYIDLVSEGTVDEKILYALRNKIDLAAAIQRDGPQDWVV